MTKTENRQFVTLLLVLGLAGLYLIYSYNIFVDESLDTVHELEIELDEALAYGAMMTLAFSAYAVRVYQSRRRQVATQFARLAEARRESYTDALTGLANRRHFDEALAAMLGDRTRDRCDAVLMIDLNGFKSVNDRYGHVAGDALLKIVGERLRAAVRAADLPARVGGDEFAVLAPRAGDRATAAAIAERIIVELAKPIVVAGATHQIGAGIGIAMSPDDGTAPGELVANADRALYAAKAEHASVARFHERAAA